jgi:hypothetical protein
VDLRNKKPYENIFVGFKQMQISLITIAINENPIHAMLPPVKNEIFSIYNCIFVVGSAFFVFFEVHHNSTQLKVMNRENFEVMNIIAQTPTHRKRVKPCRISVLQKGCNVC